VRHRLGLAARTQVISSYIVTHISADDVGLLSSWLVAGLA